jgi:hypothetical protein
MPGRLRTEQASFAKGAPALAGGDCTAGGAGNDLVRLVFFLLKPENKKKKTHNVCVVPGGRFRHMYCSDAAKFKNLFSCAPLF